MRLKGFALVLALCLTCLATTLAQSQSFRARSPVSSNSDLFLRRFAVIITAR